MTAIIERAASARLQGTARTSARGVETGIDASIERAAEALLRDQRPDGHWVFELEADATIPSEYVLLTHYLGEPTDRALERKIATYLRRRQGAHGGWPLVFGGAFNLGVKWSASGTGVTGYVVAYQ